MQGLNMAKINQVYINLVANALSSKDPFPALLEMLLDDNPGLKNEAALGLEKLGDGRAIKYLISEALKAGPGHNSVFLDIIAAWDCSGYEMELLKLGLESTFEGKNNILHSLQNIHTIPVQQKQKLISAIKLKKEITKSDKVVDINNVGFLDYSRELIAEIPLKETAKIFKFPNLRRPHLSIV